LAGYVPERFLPPRTAEEAIDVGHGLALSIVEVAVVPGRRTQDSSDPGDRAHADVQQYLGGRPAAGPVSKQPAQLVTIQRRPERVEEHEQRRPGRQRQQLRQQPAQVPRKRSVIHARRCGFGQRRAEVRIHTGVAFDEDGPHLAQIIHSLRGLHEQQWRTCRTVVVAARTGVAIEEHDPMPLGGRAGLAGEDHRIPLENPMFEHGCSAPLYEEFSVCRHVTPQTTLVTYGSSSVTLFTHKSRSAMR
jgi:hypothetical protein